MKPMIPSSTPPRPPAVPPAMAPTLEDRCGFDVEGPGLAKLEGVSLDDDDGGELVGTVMVILATLTMVSKSVFEFSRSSGGLLEYERRKNATDRWAVR